MILKGSTGSGKSTRASALVRPELTADIVPPGFCPDDQHLVDHVRLIVLGPIQHYSGSSPVRLVLDALDQIPESIRNLLLAVAVDRPDGLRFILTGHACTPVPTGLLLPFEATEETALNAYLDERAVPPSARSALLGKSGGQWLILALLADAVLADPMIDLSGLTDTIAGLYATRLEQAIKQPSARTAAGEYLAYLIASATARATGTRPR